MDIYKSGIDIIKRHSREISEELKKYTIQIFYYDPIRKKREAEGSGILIKGKNQYYLLTAAHCLKSIVDTESICIPVKNSVKKIGCNIKYLDERKNRNINADIGYCILTKEIAENVMETHSFYSILDYSPDISEEKHDPIALLGFPTSKTKSFPKSIDSIILPLFVTPLVNEDKLASSLFINLEYDINNQNGSKKRGIGLKGMSGSGIWKFNISGNTNENNLLFVPKLVGVFTEYDEKKYILKGTRIRCFTEFIRALENEPISPSTHRGNITYSVSN